MTMLANVSGLCPEVVASLEEMNITTADHLLALDTSELARMCSIAEIELEKARAVVASAVGPRRQLVEVPNGWISTNVPVLDELLDGGLKRGSVTEFCAYGCSSLTKAAVQGISDSECTSIIVGGGNGRPDYPGTQLIVDDIAKLPLCIDSLWADSVSLKTLGCDVPSVVIVDSISRIVTATLACASAARLKVRALVEEIAASLRTLAVEVNCAVLLVAPCSSDLMGRLWDHHIDVRVELVPTCEPLDSDIVYTGGPVQRRTCDNVLAYTSRKGGGPMPSVTLDLVELRSSTGSSNSPP